MHSVQQRPSAAADKDRPAAAVGTRPVDNVDLQLRAKLRWPLFHRGLLVLACLFSLFLTVLSSLGKVGYNGCFIYLGVWPA